ncbi:MAG: hypothetical protein DMF62_03820 [Acidobacteria bacterium]|nr:MAG: hypothetical protein DMF62_03820 [Acidobacteriota bacterium]
MMTTLIASTHSFHFREHKLLARSFDLGEGFGATLNLSTTGIDAPIVIFFNDLGYTQDLADAINSVTRAHSDASAEAA